MSTTSGASIHDVRRGLRRDEERAPIHLETVRLDLRFDVSNVAEALEIAEDPDRP